MPRSQPFIRTHCPIGYALDVFGDKWSLLIIRDLMFKGKHRFSEFAASEEKIATNILAKRLTTLEAYGLISRQVDPENARQRLYALTDVGRDLAPLLLEMILWSAKHDPATAADRRFVRAARRSRARVLRSIMSAQTSTPRESTKGKSSARTRPGS